MHRDTFVRDGFVHGGRRQNQRQTPAPEFARVAHHHGTPGRFRHRAIHPRFQQIWRRQPVSHVKPIHSEEQQVGAQLPQRFLGQRSNQGKRVLAQYSSGQDYFHRRIRQLRGNICRIRDNRQALEMPALARDRRGRRSGIENDYLSLPDHVHSGFRDSQFLSPVHSFFFMQGAVFQRSRFHGQRASVRSFELALMMQYLKILADRNQRGAETSSQVAHQDAPVR